ncbi:DUF2164 family protein [Bacillus lacus]|uniref:DUF2164 family protein n=1 Tax=Metabacillus lacus TaxID=1983721 RepID=A0A7X2IY11_9BACI|nr:DUF2164 family protein [Metabacillus lacus]
MKKTLSKEERQQMLSDIQRFFYDTRGEEIGELAAGHVLDFIEESIAPHYYNQALDHAKTLLDDRLASVTEELYVLEKQLKR